MYCRPTDGSINETNRLPDRAKEIQYHNEMSTDAIQEMLHRFIYVQYDNFIFHSFLLNLCTFITSVINNLIDLVNGSSLI